MKEIKLTQDKVAIVDDEDYEYLIKYKWCSFYNNNSFYAMRGGKSVKGKRESMIYMHRFIMKAKKGQIVDHKNGNTLDNRKENLRFCTVNDNVRNRKMQKNNKTGYRGVTYRSDLRLPWCATIRVNGKLLRLGRFHTKEEAARAYNDAAKRYFGEFARLNTINN